MQDPVPTDSAELLRTLIRNACVNDGSDGRPPSDRAAPGAKDNSLAGGAV